MRDSGMRQVAHETEVKAPADTVHRLLAEVDNWPRVFGSVIAVEHEEAPEGEQRLRIRYVEGDVPRSRPLRRIVEPAALRINFQELVTEPPLAGLGGAWVVEPLGEESSRVRLLHEYRVVGDDPGALDRIGEWVDASSRRELAALKENVEFAHAAAERTFSFEDTVRIDGA
ncbi:aromatase/cyclase, partial [Streptomyces sp. NPDC047022]|uniref:aromatase/cyclase n=1 Tax=Streptomyces sp. NPDC047022 TaxID=3155737 RepID=UPI003411F502